jgi:hypothetical protein
MLQSLLDAGLGWVARRVAHRHWRWHVAALSLLLAVVCQFPKVNHAYAQLITHTEWLDYNLARIKEQAAHPLTPHPDLPMTHLAKMAFRLAVPLLLRWLHLSLVQVLALQVGLGLVMFWYAAGWLARSLGGDRVAAALFTLALSRTYFGFAFTYDLFGYFDGLAFVLLLAMLGAQRWVFIFALCLLGGFVDERALVASLIVAFWYGARARDWQGPAGPGWLLTRPASAIYAAWAVYAAVRVYLTLRFQLPNHRALVGVSALSHNAWQEILALGFSDSLKSFWLVLVLAALVLLRQRRYGVLVLLLACAAPSFGGAFLVTDNTRSLAYGMPLVFIVLHLLGRCLTLAEQRYLAVVVMFFALLMPSYFITGWAQYVGPIWMVALRALTKQFYL